RGRILSGRDLASSFTLSKNPLTPDPSPPRGRGEEVESLGQFQFHGVLARLDGAFQPRRLDRRVLRRQRVRAELAVGGGPRLARPPRDAVLARRQTVEGRVGARPQRAVRLDDAVAARLARLLVDALEDDHRAGDRLAVERDGDTDGVGGPAMVILDPL